MNKPNERELRELLTMHDIPDAPADLADRIKAEIPDDLGVTDDGSAEPFEAAPAPPTRFAWRHLALAATLLAMIGGSFLAYRVLRSSVQEPALQSSIAEHQAQDVGSSQRSGESDSALSQDPQRGPTRGAEPSPSSSPRDAADKRDAPGEKKELAIPAEELAKRREELRKVMLEKIQLRSQLEEPAVAPAAGEAGRLDADASTRGASELEALGYVAGIESREMPLPPSPASPPPQRGEMPKPKARKVPMPGDVATQRTFLDEVTVTSEAPEVVESSSAASIPVAPSTGGTAEPNDEPYGDVFFEGHGVNPFIDTEDDRLSTFGLDVDTGSYTVMRRYLHDGHLPPPDAVRIEELVNYFDYRDEPPTDGDFAIHAQGAPSIYGEGERYYLLRFNLHGREIDDRDRKPADLTFVVDVSGSMARENRLGLVKKALALLIDQLRDDDRIALVVYGSRGRVLLEPSADHGAIRRAVEALQPEGSTNAEEGLRLAYELAERHRRRGAIHRVILCSDGVANVGRTSAGSIFGEIERYAAQGVELTTVGFGMGNYNDTLMERLADTGNGRYAYVDSLDEARRIFVEGLTGTLQTIAAEARVQVEFNPEVVARYRLLGYENRDIADERFRDDTVDAGEIGAGHTVTALYEIKLHRKLERRAEIGTLHLRWASIAAGEMMEISRRVTGGDFARTWEKAPAALRLTALVAELGEVLRRSHWAKKGDLDDVFRRAQKVSAEFEGDRDVAEFVSLVGRAADYRRVE